MMHCEKKLKIKMLFWLSRTNFDRLSATKLTHDENNSPPFLGYDTNPETK